MITAFLERYNHKKVYRFLIYAFIFCLPFQINFIIYSPDIFFSGGFNIYTHFLVYIGDIFLLLSLIFIGIDVFLRRLKFEKITNKLFVILTLFIIACEVSFLSAIEKDLTFFLFLRLFLFYYLYILLENRLVSFFRLKKIFIYSIVFQAVLAIFQFILQSSIGLSFLGEPVLGTEIANVSKIDIGGFQMIRSYGTFPHPNVLAAFILTALFFVYQIFEKDNKVPLIVMVCVLLIGLVLTFSRTGILGLIIMIFFAIRYSDFLKSKLKKIVVFVVLIVVLIVILFPFKNLFIERFKESESVSERIKLMNISTDMFINHPMGVGLSNFTLRMNEYSDQKMFPWEYQPVHNVFMLVFNEIGLIGGILFLILWLVKVKDTPRKNLGFILAIFLFMMLDHFFFSMYQGQALLFMIFTSGFIKD